MKKKNKSNSKVIALIVSIAILIISTATLIFICTGGYTTGKYTATVTGEKVSYTITYKLKGNNTYEKTTITTTSTSENETKVAGEWKIEEGVLKVKPENTVLFVTVGEIDEFELKTTGAIILSSLTEEDVVLVNRCAKITQIAAIVVMSLSLMITAASAGMILAQKRKKK